MTEQTDNRAQRTPVLAWSMLALLLTLVCVRTTSGYTPFPWWDGDPFRDGLIPTGLTPTTALIVNLLMMLCSMGVVAGVRRAGGRVLLVPGVLLAVAQLVVVIHAYGDVGTLVGSTDLIAAGCVGYACWHATQIPGARRVIAGITLGLVCVLGVVGLHQVLVQHPQTVAAFEVDRTAFLESRGWGPDSFQARTFERRLGQADPTAWFGLTNVYASLVGAMGAALLILGVRARRDATMAILVLAGLGGVGLVVFSGSTGALGALAIALAIILICGKLPRVRTGPAIAAASTLVVLGVIARGIIGERVGELSILFRSQYMLGAWRAWMEEPLLGVGVGNFQEAYARLKPPTSPEDVASPHSIGFDLISTLGIGGVALFGVFVAMVWSIGRRNGSVVLAEDPPARMLLRVIGAVVLLSFAVSIRVATGASTLEIIGVQAIGTLAWFGLAWLIVTRSFDSACQWALAGGAGALMIHGQLDLTPTYGVSASLFAVMIGAAGVVGSGGHHRPLAPRALGSSVLVMVLLLGWRGSTLFSWERSIGRAGKTAHEFVMLDPQNAGDEPGRWHQEWTAHAGAVSDLSAALGLRPGHLPTRIALTEQLMWLGEATIEDFDDQNNADQMWDMAVDVSGFEPSEGGHTPGEHRWAGTVLMARAAAVDQGPMADGLRARAIEHWEISFGQTPHDPDLAVMIMDGHLRQRAREAARAWAQRALEINDRMRLDPLRQLEPQTLARVRSVAE